MPNALAERGSDVSRQPVTPRKHRLTRTQSAFSPVVFSPLFTGETVSLVDVDISQRGLSSPHPPTPPPPPRRSLSLLDDISGTLPVLVAPMGSSLHLPLPPPRPPPSASLRLPADCPSAGDRGAPRPARPAPAVPALPPGLQQLRSQFARAGEVRVVLGTHELGGRRDEAEGEAGWVLPGARQFGPAVHPEPELSVAGHHPPHPHGALQRDLQPVVPPQV
ncbi:suppressor of cytokine signaling 7 [Columba livia]|uniref:Suppressor of cytokine signaling 7 n=1 Tax=Columba livia TaxID=8932 RepID=A0A2I0LSG3_COLLI|nr:suppressor of cytokine signaling 7 [Columba livia]